MPPLPDDLRNLLERAVIKARDEAEKAAKASLVRLAVHQSEPYSTLSQADRSLRDQLRAEARRFGQTTESQSQSHKEPNGQLVTEVAYAQWHRMLFARILAENDLLIHPSGVPVTLEECAELAADEGESDGWMLAARYASAMLPGIFRQEDPITQVRFDAAGRLALERLINDLPHAVFVADDSLGWVYQFWQSRQKEIINKSGRKIGGADIAPVTQLFTEHYMVQFLLHNSLGAWWAARHDGETGGWGDGETERRSEWERGRGGEGENGGVGVELDYLRRNDDGSPAAGSFPGWPDRAADLRILDPCCGSGHFLVAAFALMCRFRMHEEGLNEREAGDAVMRDNLFGLEIDPRCTQIAAFSLALAAWKSGGYRPLPLPNIACSGLPVGASAYEFTHLAGGDREMEAALLRLHRLFEQAPDLGSLIDPERVAREEGTRPYGESLFAPTWDEISEKLDRALATVRADDPAAAIFGATARGVARAAELLTRTYDLVCTNVPYLARGKQGIVIRNYLEKYHNDAKADLATAFVDRCLQFCKNGPTLGLVTPQNWLSLGAYEGFRQRLLRVASIAAIGRLGPRAFETIGGEVVNVALFVLTGSMPLSDNQFIGLDASALPKPADKAGALRHGLIVYISQVKQLENPDARIVLSQGDVGALLNTYASSFVGFQNGDTPRFVFCFWEIDDFRNIWRLFQLTTDKTDLFRGYSGIIRWENGAGPLMDQALVKGTAAWGKQGIAVRSVGLPCTLYSGEIYDQSTAAIVPHNPTHTPAIWAFCASQEFNTAVRRIDRKRNVTNATLVKVPFDLDRWQKVADEQYPNGLPEPYSDDATQWLFKGHPARSANPIQVAVARLLGYRWPENDAHDLDGFANTDGIVCLPPVSGQPPAVERLRALLASAYQADWTSALENRLISDAGSAGRTLDDWLQNDFFSQHCRLFHNRPFLWHIWDGHKEGFSAIVNYHKLDRAKLERLIYSYLGDWINTQRHADSEGVAGANARLVAAVNLQKKLTAIAEGEPPFDIYVRWKPLEKQPIGWEPDINDGVRMNIRPFVTAGVLRSKFTINWNKDRGTNPDGSERLNEVHLTRAEKEKGRAMRARI
jgi:hypothetical protein